ncbi:AAA family ATPase [Dactylosporangium sp. CS-047395]|uniref:restriction endonuclease n=1 Tax=Dactylosporangium sp. CS-047395 TaxID=3239936 RepID=UPI003D8F1DE5
MDEELVYQAARRVLEAGLAEDGSAFTPGRPVWTAEAAEALYAAFVQQPDAGRGSFVDKLAGQLAGAPPAAIQLMAELIYLHLVLPRDIGGTAKRAVIGGALRLLPEPVTVPGDLDVVLDTGLVRAGTAYMTQRDRQIAYLVRFVHHWKRLPAVRRDAALRDPWAFREIADAVPIGSAFSQRNILLNLAFPETFPAIVSRRDKARIVVAFAGVLPQVTGDQERDLAEIRRVLEDRDGTAVRFYAPPYVGQWRDTDEEDERPAQGWLVRGAKVHGHNLIGQWLQEGFCSIAFPELPELEPGLARTELDQELQHAVPDMTPNQRGARVGVLDRFLNRMREGDIVVTVDWNGFYVGTITGPVTWVDSPGRVSNRRRSVEWANPDLPIPRDELSETARNKLAGQLTVIDLGTATEEFLALVPDDGRPAPAPIPAPVDVELREPTRALADRLHIDLDWLEETVDLLRDKKQIILYGPPGTGKTYLAYELARFLTGEDDNAYRLVQFHPSYSYEDFFEGFRPVRGDQPGAIAFSLEPARSSSSSSKPGRNRPSRSC